MGKISQTVNKSSPLRILVVDDEFLIRWSLSETLTDSGHLVSEAGDGETALRTLTDGNGRFDVVLLDYHLPDSHDLALLSQIRQVAPGTAVIMMTAFGTPEMSDAALRIGAYSVVPKPFEVHDMADLVLEAHASAPNRS
jgi:two-component system response regulator AtoC